MDEVIDRRLESIVVEANVIIQRVVDVRARCIGIVPDSVTVKLIEGAQQIQLDVASLIGFRKEKERANGKSKGE